MNKETKQGFIRLGIGILILAIVLGACSVMFDGNDEQPKQKDNQENIFECGSDITYMTEYEEHFNKLYYKHSVSGMDWKKTKETEEECQYYTTINVENISGNKQKYDLYITTSLDKENKKEHVKSLIVNNIEVYK